MIGDEEESLAHVPEPYRFDIDMMREQVASAQPIMRAQWLAESWRDPDRFMAALCQYSTTLLTPAGKSSPTAGFDLYCDAVVRHTGSNRDAFRCFDAERGLSTLSFADLHERAGSLSGLLRERGLKPGDAVTWVLPFGEQFLICLCAALRIGAVASFLPPLGERYVARRLSLLKPACVLTERMYLRLCAGHKAVALDEATLPHVHDDRSHTYAPPAPALMLLSPLRDPPDLPNPVSGTVAYLRALRDGLLVYGLRPGDGLCAPGFELLQNQPAMLLSAMLCGATYIHITPSGLPVLARDPTLLNRLGVTCLGLSIATRDALRKAPHTPLPRLQSWFRPVLEPFDWAAWTDLNTRHGLGALPNFTVHIDSAQGGIQLFSSRLRGAVAPFVTPTPGCAWKLISAELSGQQAAAQIGVFLPAGPKKESAYLILSRNGDGYFVSGLMTPRRTGQVYPAAEVEAALRELPWIVGSMVLAVPEGSEVTTYAFVLLVFVGANNPDSTARSHIERHLTFVLAAEFLPDCIEIIPMYPRLIDNEKPTEIDHAWCRFQYLSGTLQRKKERRSGQLLTALRKAALDLRLPTRGGA